MNFTDYLLENAPDDRLAILTKGANYTYGDLRAAARQVAGELSALDVQPGERVGILGVNSLFWVAAYLATMKLGAVAVPFATTLSPEEVLRNQRFVACKAVAIERRQLRKYGEAFPGAAQVTEELLESAGPGSWPATPPDFDDRADAALMATSGTTQRPRMVRITHRNLKANTDSIIEYLALNENERIMVILPFYYCFGTSLLHTHLRAGGSAALSNTFTFPETTLDMMAETACTGFAGVPTTFQLLLRNSTFPRRSLPALGKIQQAGGKLQTVLIQELIAAQPQARVFVMYGQTEATARLSYLPPAMLESKLGSIGRGIPGVTLRVLDENGEPVQPGITGEIIASGDNISPGYLDDPEASAEKFIAGDLHTGDLAQVDADGYIFVVDRKSDFIKSYGFRVSSQEVEARVMEIADVVSAAAVGAPDLEAGEAVTVFVALKSGAESTPESIIRYCQERMPKHMAPQAVHVVKSLPVNAHGKVVKGELKKLLEKEGGPGG